jgi:outer membrane protein insertion porin family
MNPFLVQISIIVTLSFTFCSEVLAQKVVTSIEFSGLKKTKEAYLRQFITTSIGDEIDSLQLSDDRQRMLNLGILQEIVPQIHEEAAGIKVIFECQEMFSALPVFTLGKTVDTFWLKAGFQHLNFTGRGDKFYAYYQFYDRHTFKLKYEIDRIKHSNWGMTSSLIKWALVEPIKSESGLFDYDYTSYTGYVSAVRFFTYRETLDFGMGFFNEHFRSKGQPGDELAKIVQGNKLQSKIIFKSNHLDYRSFYIKGYYNQLNVEFFHSLDEMSNFATIYNEFRYFNQLGSKLNWANRLRAGIATNDENPFAPFVLDSYLNIRGVGNRVDRGTGSFIINTEMRYTLCDFKKFAAQGVGFIDAGTWRKPGGSFNDFTKIDNIRIFTGLGFRLIYKRAFDTMLRIDYGFDYAKNDGLVIGIGQYF